MIKTILCWAVAFLLAVLIGGCSKREHYTVPVEYCKAQYTGRTRDEVQTSDICVSYRSDGTCATSVPTSQTVTYRELAVNCSFTEWR